MCFLVCINCFHSNLLISIFVGSVTYLIVCLDTSRWVDNMFTEFSDIIISYWRVWFHTTKPSCFSIRDQPVNLRREAHTENIPFRTGLVSQQINVHLAGVCHSPWHLYPGYLIFAMSKFTFHYLPCSASWSANSCKWWPWTPAPSSFLLVLVMGVG